MNVATYRAGNSVLHRLDARAKIVLLLAVSITLFCVETWSGLAVLALAVGIAVVVSRMPIRSALRQLAPVGIILALTLLFNTFSFDGTGGNPAGPAAVSAGIAAGMSPLPVVGGLYFVPEGFVRGCFYVMRVVVLLAASLVFTSTTDGNAITDAVTSALRPLKALRVPVDDIAMVISIALRFIPVTIDEFERVRAAQTARGARFDTGGLIARLRTWTTVLVPLFVGLFRRADDLAVAMDARCYGSAARTSLRASRFSATSVLVCVVGVAACVALAVVL